MSERTDSWELFIAPFEEYYETPQEAKAEMFTALDYFALDMADWLEANGFVGAADFTRQSTLVREY